MKAEISGYQCHLILYLNSPGSGLVFSLLSKVNSRKSCERLGQITIYTCVVGSFFGSLATSSVSGF